MKQNSAFDFQVVDAQGNQVDLAQYRGKVVLVVNVASKCGFTPQYTGLEKLYQRFGQQGFVIIGFPCNQFGSQEPGSDQDIQSFCSTQYQVSFPVLAKIQVNGSQEAPLYSFLKEQAPGLLNTKAIKWNFTKFLIGRDGRVLKRYAPSEDPENLTQDIEQALAT